MAGRPPPRGHNDDDLLGLDDEGPVYRSGQPPPISDDRMLHDYDAETRNPPRISVSHDDFVGRPNTAGLPGGPGPAGSAQQQPPTLGDAGRSYSQTSGLGNYQRYSDADNDAYSDNGNYYATGGNID